HSHINISTIYFCTITFSTANDTDSLFKTFVAGTIAGHVRAPRRRVPRASSPPPRDVRRPLPAGRPVQHGPPRRLRRGRGAPLCVVAGVAGGALAGAAGRGLCHAHPTSRPCRPGPRRGATVDPVLRSRSRAH